MPGVMTMAGNRACRRANSLLLEYRE